MNELLVQQIYDNTISTILTDVPEKHQQAIKESYKNYLFNRCKNISVNEDNLKQLVKEKTEFEISFWKNMPLLSKLSTLITDGAFFNIVRISNEGYEYAQDRLLNGKLFDKEKAQECIRQLKDLREKVMLFNALTAEMYISEGILDYEYASGMTDNMSLRMGRKIR